MATAANGREKTNTCLTNKLKNRLDSDWPSHGRRLHSECLYAYFVKYFSNSSFDRFAPSSVSRIDFAFVAGFEM
jgi:hypothetical protein